MNVTVPMLLVSTVAAAFAPQTAAQEPNQPKVSSRRPVDVSVEGLGEAARRASGDTTRGGSLGLSARRTTGGLDTPLDCLERLADQATGGCLTASSTPTLGMLYPYPGLNNVFVPQAFVGGGENNQAIGLWSTVAGGLSNVASGYYRSKLVGLAAVGGGYGNIAYGSNSTVGGGSGNTASGFQAFVGGGSANTASGRRSTVAGGDRNRASGFYAAIGGGLNNTAYGSNATVGGGLRNDSSGYRATIGGGLDNTASGSRGPTVCGGQDNTASGNWAAVAGGRNNTASGIEAVVAGGGENIAYGSLATVAGGYRNAAQGDYSFAAGRNAFANHDGTFVWGDSQRTFKPSSVTDEFNVYASGGVRMFTNSAATTGVLLAAGGSTWTMVSDRDAKENIEPVDVRAVLDEVAGLPLATWNYKAQDDSIRHMGPMAQDFYAAFGLGLGDKTIDTIDPNGVALAAIQGLNAELEELRAEKDAKIAENKSEIDALRTANEALLARVERLESLAEVSIARGCTEGPD